MPVYKNVDGVPLFRTLIAAVNPSAHQIVLASAGPHANPFPASLLIVFLQPPSAFAMANFGALDGSIDHTA